ncbi:hypothetical protein GPECTOR_42g805 [Gonium pectorale]|uniref:Uncharacterized protein n=1 Tax=Gonium pectorale TaxID=33097 RepID=A0A150G9S5_GONPE|nr:hypothetical protein GPECTOR_42g805 [Gonium pectorale]|eukprot:KXZ46594.1 hypothetical protein GPECTOR_42g805 [Gonium pectorale]
MSRWSVSALLDATRGWSPTMFAAVSNDWRLDKVARLLEARGPSFTVRCCGEWEPEYLQVLLPELDPGIVRRVLGALYFETDDKYLSPWDCRCILEAFRPRACTRLLRHFDAKEVARVMQAGPADDDDDEEGDEEAGIAGRGARNNDEDGEDEEDEDEEGDEDEEDSLDGFIVYGDEEEEEGEVGEEEEYSSEDDDDD